MQLSTDGRTLRDLPDTTPQLVCWRNEARGPDLDSAGILKAFDRPYRDGESSAA